MSRAGTHSLAGAAQKQFSPRGSNQRAPSAYQISGPVSQLIMAGIHPLWPPRSCSVSWVMMVIPASPYAVSLWCNWYLMDLEGSRPLRIRQQRLRLWLTARVVHGHHCSSSAAVRNDEPAARRHHCTKTEIVDDMFQIIATIGQIIRNSSINGPGTPSLASKTSGLWYGVHLLTTKRRIAFCLLISKPAYGPLPLRHQSPDRYNPILPSSHTFSAP
jgi:hypothetical protein